MAAPPVAKARQTASARQPQRPVILSMQAGTGEEVANAGARDDARSRADLPVNALPRNDKQTAAASVFARPCVSRLLPRRPVVPLGKRNDRRPTRTILTRCPDDSARQSRERFFNELKEYATFTRAHRRLRAAAKAAPHSQSGRHLATYLAGGDSHIGLPRAVDRPRRKRGVRVLAEGGTVADMPRHIGGKISTVRPIQAFAPAPVSRQAGLARLLLDRTR